MTDLQGTKTQMNLIKAFAGESMARNRYTYYSKIAKEEGYEQIAAIFLETADNERVHAKRFFKFLGCENTPLKIDDAIYPIGISNTEKNLEYSIEGEHEENTILYPGFSKIAKEEGFDEIAKCFIEIVESEIGHEKRYIALLENIKEDKVFKKDKKVLWKCRKCGYLYSDTDAPKICPACLHPKAYFELYCQNY